MENSRYLTKTKTATSCRSINDKENKFYDIDSRGHKGMKICSFTSMKKEVLGSMEGTCIIKRFTVVINSVP